MKRLGIVALVLVFLVVISQPSAVISTAAPAHSSCQENFAPGSSGRLLCDHLVGMLNGRATFYLQGNEFWAVSTLAPDSWYEIAHKNAIHIVPVDARQIVLYVYSSSDKVITQKVMTGVNAGDVFVVWYDPDNDNIVVEKQ